MNMSRVWFTTPSVVFSMGTTPKFALPRSTSLNTSLMLLTGTYWADAPNFWVQAICVKVARGPR